MGLAAAMSSTSRWGKYHSVARGRAKVRANVWIGVTSPLTQRRGLPDRASRPEFTRSALKQGGEVWRSKLRPKKASLVTGKAGLKAGGTNAKSRSAERGPGCLAPYWAATCRKIGPISGTRPPTGR